MISFYSLYYAGTLTMFFAQTDLMETTGYFSYFNRRLQKYKTKLLNKVIMQYYRQSYMKKNKPLKQMRIVLKLWGLVKHIGV